MKKVLFVVTLLALSPLAATAGGVESGDTRAVASQDKACFFQMGTCAVVERRAYSM